MKIETLTPEQEALIPIVRDEWIKFCLGGDCLIEKEKAKKGIEWVYSLANLSAPKFIAFAEGPLAAQIIARVFPDTCKAVSMKMDKQSVEQSVDQSVRQSVEQSVWQSVEQSVWQSVRLSVWQSVEQSVEQSVWQSVEQSVGQSVGQSVWQSVRLSVWQSVEQSVRLYPLAHANPYDGCAWASGYYAYYDFFERIGITTKEQVKLKELTLTGTWDFLWYKDLCVVTCRPSKIHKNKRGQLHCSNGPAAQWPSGEVYWFLNGISVNEKIVLHPEKLTKNEILGEKNVDVRREMLRQIGMERFCALTKPKVLDKQGDYELLSIDLSDALKDCRFLSMLNPSIKVRHVEGVERECATVEQAISWRAGSLIKKGELWKPIQLT